MKRPVLNREQPSRSRLHINAMRRLALEGGGYEAGESSGYSTLDPNHPPDAFRVLRGPKLAAAFPVNITTRLVTCTRPYLSDQGLKDVPSRTDRNRLVPHIDITSATWSPSQHRRPRVDRRVLTPEGAGLTYTKGCLLTMRLVILSIQRWRHCQHIGIPLD